MPRESFRRTHLSRAFSPEPSHHHAYPSCRDESGVICIIGPPGSGKTKRLSDLASISRASAARHQISSVLAIDDVDRLSPIQTDGLASVLELSHLNPAVRVLLSATRISAQGEVARLIRHHHATVFELPKLRRTETARIATEILGQRLTTESEATLHHLSMGRPGLVLRLIESNLLAGTLLRCDGGWHFAHEIVPGGAALYLDGPSSSELTAAEREVENFVAAGHSLDEEEVCRHTSHDALESLLAARVLVTRFAGEGQSERVEICFRQPLRRLVTLRRLGPEVVPDLLLELRRSSGFPPAPTSHVVGRSGSASSSRGPLKSHLVVSPLCGMPACPDATTAILFGHRGETECPHWLCGVFDKVLRGEISDARGCLDSQSNTDSPEFHPVARALIAIAAGTFDIARSELLPVLRNLDIVPTSFLATVAIWAVAYLAHVTADEKLAGEVRAKHPELDSLPDAMRLPIKAWLNCPGTSSEQLDNLIRARDDLDDAGIVVMSDFIRLDILGIAADPDVIPIHRRPRMSSLSILIDEVHQANRSGDTRALLRQRDLLDNKGGGLSAAILTAVAWRLALRVGSHQEAFQLRNVLDHLPVVTSGARLPVLAPSTDRNGLTAREAEVLAMAGEGFSNREIAELLTLSVRTVEGHVFRSMRRLGLHSRRQLCDVVAQDAEGWAPRRPPPE